MLQFVLHLEKSLSKLDSISKNPPINTLHLFFNNKLFFNCVIKTINLFYLLLIIFFSAWYFMNNSKRRFNRTPLISTGLLVSDTGFVLCNLAKGLIGEDAEPRTLNTWTFRFFATKTGLLLLIGVTETLLPFDLSSKRISGVLFRIIICF